MTIDPSDSDKPLKKCDDAYYEKVRIMYINDYNLTLPEAAKYVSKKGGYELPNFSTLRSIKSRKALQWEKRNTDKTIKSKSIKKADSIALKRKQNPPKSATGDAAQQERTLFKKPKNVATQEGESVATGGATSKGKSVATKQGQLLPVGGKRTANNDAVLGVTETTRDDDTEPVHDNETIDLRAVVIDRHRTNLATLNDYLLANVGRVNRASDRLEGLLDLVINNPLISAHDASAEDKKAVLALLEDNPLIKALNMLQKVAKNAIYATSEAMRGIGTIQAAERVAYDLDNFNDDGGDSDVDTEGEDEHYKRLEEAAMKSKVEMLERSAKLRAVSSQIEQKIDDDASVGIIDD